MNRLDKTRRIPVVDIFAGPGGLGEGFSRFPYDRRNTNHFKIRLSIEKENRARETLRLRSFFRQFPEDQVPELYYQLLRQSSRPLAERLDELFDSYPDESRSANEEALCLELGNSQHQTTVNYAVAKAVQKEKHWVLLGGPPCQAYSLVGRSRNRGNVDYVPSEDKRQFLYQEYLKVIADQLPSIFVMENVKGLLSATVKNERVFDQIVSDLKEPRRRLGITKRKPQGIKSTYRLFALTTNDSSEESELTDFVIRMENYGIPQARHRLIILGIRDDLGVDKLNFKLKEQAPIKSKAVLSDLPRLRSGLSKENDTEETWKKRILSIADLDWFGGLTNGLSDVKQSISKAIDDLAQVEFDRGGEWVKSNKQCRYLKDWYNAKRIKGALNHETRGHIVDDLHRYLFAASYAMSTGVSPTLKEFPRELLPKHRNVQKALNGSLFADRFRVQPYNRPSTTITSHISKDGHYYIHPDPTQCRSLTVREAARLQTFPDDYFFCGPRTSQYTQVGNAVPPLLAHQIAKIVFNVLTDSGAV